MSTENANISLLTLCLSESLPYGLLVKVPAKNIDGEEFTVVEMLKSVDVELGTVTTTGHTAEIAKVRPVLRPMELMTPDERKEYDLTMDLGYAAAYNQEIFTASTMVDFFNRNHLDYRGLTKKGIADAVTEEWNPYV